MEIIIEQVEMDSVQIIFMLNVMTMQILCVYSRLKKPSLYLVLLLQLLGIVQVDMNQTQMHLYLV